MTDNLSPDQAIKNAEEWHKQNSSSGNIDIVKKLLKKAIKTVPYTTTIGNQTLTTTIKIVNPHPIIHNEGKIFLQFCGWSINLLDDGTWYWEDTSGG